jgi:hypothetical protein
MAVAAAFVSSSASSAASRPSAAAPSRQHGGHVPELRGAGRAAAGGARAPRRQLSRLCAAQPAGALRAAVRGAERHQQPARWVSRCGVLRCDAARQAGTTRSLRKKPRAPLAASSSAATLHASQRLLPLRYALPRAPMRTPHATRSPRRAHASPDRTPHPPHSPAHPAAAAAAPQARRARCSPPAPRCAAAAPPPLLRRPPRRWRRPSRCSSWLPAWRRRCS